MPWTEIPAPTDDGPYPFNLHHAYSLGGSWVNAKVETFGMGEETTHIHFYTADRGVARHWYKDLKGNLPTTLVTYSLDRAWLDRAWMVEYDEEAEADENTNVTKFTCFSCDEMHDCRLAWNIYNVRNRCLAKED